MENLTENQKFFAAALKTESLTIKQLKEMANDDGAYFERVSYLKIIELEIATKETNKFGEERLSRGPRWLEFHDKYGADIVERGLAVISIQQELGPIFSGTAMD